MPVQFELAGIGVEVQPEGVVSSLALLSCPERLFTLCDQSTLLRTAASSTVPLLLPLTPSPLYRPHKHENSAVLTVQVAQHLTPQLASRYAPPSSKQPNEGLQHLHYRLSGEPADLLHHKAGALWQSALLKLLDEPLKTSRFRAQPTALISRSSSY